MTTIYECDVCHKRLSAKVNSRTIICKQTLQEHSTFVLMEVGSFMGGGDLCLDCAEKIAKAAFLKRFPAPIKRSYTKKAAKK